MQELHVNKIIFYTIGHNGDIHYSREFIKDIISKIPNIQYEYKIKYSPKLVKDISNLSIKKFDVEQFWNEELAYDSSNNSLLINTWIGSSKSKYIPNDTGCCLQANYNKYDSIYSFLRLTMNPIESYIPDINWSSYDISGIDNFFLSNNKKFYCLISNGDVLSGQSKNHNLNRIIEPIAERYKNVGFILTNSNNKIIKENVFYTDDIIKTDGGDLNEIGYIGTKCDIIIGRGSGPFCFCHNKTAMNDPSKTLISFTNLKNDGCWVPDELLVNGAKQVWSNNFDLSNMHDIIDSEIRKYYGK